MRQYLHWFVGCLLCFGFSQAVNAAIVFDEVSSNTDLSTNNLLPTVLDFNVGENTIIGTVANSASSGDSDFFTFNIGPGEFLESITVSSYAGSDTVSYLAIEDDTSFPLTSSDLVSIQFPGSMFSSTDFLGGSTFGLFDVTGGFDIMPRLGNPFVGGGSGFTGVLGPGDYSVIVQQTGSESTYGLTFNVSAVPEPSTVGLSAAGLFAVGFRRRRRS